MDLLSNLVDRRFAPSTTYFMQTGRTALPVPNQTSQRPLVVLARNPDMIRNRKEFARLFFLQQGRSDCFATTFKIEE